MSPDQVMQLISMATIAAACAIAACLYVGGLNKPNTPAPKDHAAANQDVGDIDDRLVAVALQALHRWRKAAYQAACTACDLTGQARPDERQFGLDEATTVRSLGSEPRHQP